MKQKISLNLRVLLFQEDKTWVAQCLEWDIAAQGKTLDDALNSFEQSFVGQIILDIEGGRKPLATTPRSPKEYQANDQEIIDTSWAANSTEREIYEKEIVGFIGSYADHEGQEQQFTKVDFEQALQKVSRKIKK